MTSKHVRFLSQNRPGPRMGMGHYERLLIQNIGALASPTEWRFDIVFDGRANGTRLDVGQIGGRVSAARFAGFSSGRMGRWPWSVAKLVSRVGSGLGLPGMYHSLALSYPAPGRRPSVYTIHDLPPARFADEGPVPKWAKQAANEADLIMTPSKFGKTELVELLDLDPARVEVVPYGCEHDRFHAGVLPANAQTLQKYNLSGSFLAYAGGFTRRKNVRALLEAWKQVQGQYPTLSLALFGPKEQLARIAEQVNAPRAVVAGYIGRDDLPGMLKASSGLVCPSIYEGFGLPPLEAMACGVPVVAVRAGAIPEVVGDAAILVDDGSSESLSAGISQLLDDPVRAERLREQGQIRAGTFSWPDHARTVLDLYRRVLGGSRRGVGGTSAASA